MKNLPKKRAVELTRLIRDSFVGIEKYLVEFIKGQGWVSMGFVGFNQWWDANLSDITVAQEIRPQVIYQLIDEGLTADQVAAAVKGASTEMVENLKRQKDNGVPPELASTRVRHKPNRDDPYTTMFLRVQRADLDDWRRTAAMHDLSTEQIVIAAAKKVFGDLREATPKADAV